MFVTTLPLLTRLRPDLEKYMKRRRPMTKQILSGRRKWFIVVVVATLIYLFALFAFNPPAA